MAVTGVMLVGFLFFHALGNMKVFLGQESFDHYSHWLRTVLEPILPHEGFLWLARIGLLAAVGGHIWSAAALTIRAKKARPVKYAHRKPVQGSYAARTMRWGGVIVVLFVIYHILDLTTGTLNPVGAAGKPYGNVTADFAPSRWYVTFFYVLAIVAIGFHLRHGLWSAIQTLGRSNARRERFLKGVALGFTLLLCAMFLSVPFAVLTGLVK
ncbi:succinate dehydrogenase [Longispora fulva]|uniref:Succinate dehydrogenase / fumarate reductase cytochrome b subunit n=2 Tax=Longispora fulva TaxID=619741 RepID=A0A8J7KVK0_9ACTN|nr:succinate dehydrogenase / fumarate reductase cytochrome b subunit [Longispora fulva]GIG56365.1 succinate dehydrogenase [Longispora fulva]